MDDIRPPIPVSSNRFIHSLRRDMRDKGYAYKTEKTYVHWIKRYILFNGKQHPEQLGAEHINRFLSHLANEQNCSPATQRIALNALVYLYRKIPAGRPRAASIRTCTPEAPTAGRVDTCGS